MEKYGKVHEGSSAGDFSVINLQRGDGWVVTCHHPDILTFVSTDEAVAELNEMIIGLTGRSKRDADAKALKIIHVENNLI